MKRCGNCSLAISVRSSYFMLRYVDMTLLVPLEKIKTAFTPEAFVSENLKVSFTERDII